MPRSATRRGAVLTPLPPGCDHQAALALHQVSEILAVPGAVQARDAAAAKQLLDALQAPPMAPLLRAKGMEAAQPGR